MPPSYITKYEEEESPIMADLEWLWNFKGQLKVIATPYHEGQLYATHPNQLIPIVDYLEEMHKHGYVHGDIRGYNMILNCEDPKNPKGWLIDFDFGGHIDTSPKYPIGYIKSLPDGFRRGVTGQPITFEDDWFTLGEIIFGQCYRLDCCSDREKVDIQLWYELQAHFPSDYNKLKLEGSSLPPGVVATFLRKYLQTASDHGFFFRLGPSFELSLKEGYGIIPKEPSVSTLAAKTI